MPDALEKENEVLMKERLVTCVYVSQSAVCACGTGDFRMGFFVVGIHVRLGGMKNVRGCVLCVAEKGGSAGGVRTAGRAQPDSQALSSSAELSRGRSVD